MTAGVFHACEVTKPDGTRFVSRTADPEGLRRIYTEASGCTVRPVYAEIAGQYLRVLGDRDEAHGPEEAAAIAAEILGGYMAGWSDEDVEFALRGIGSVTLYRPEGGVA